MKKIIVLPLISDNDICSSEPAIFVPLLLSQNQILHTDSVIEKYKFSQKFRLTEDYTH